MLFASSGGASAAFSGPGPYLSTDDFRPTMVESPMPDTSTSASASAVDPTAQAATLRHGAFEDAQALFAGGLFVAMALMLFN